MNSKGWKHDRSILRESVYAQRGLILKGSHGRLLLTYGDKGYRPDEDCVLEAPNCSRNRSLTALQPRQNRKMSKARIAIENMQKICGNFVFRNAS